MEIKILPCPHLVFYVDSVPAPYTAVTNGPVIRILKSSPYGDALYVHELTHVIQFWLCALIAAIPIVIAALTITLGILQFLPMTLAVHPLLYKGVQGYRYHAEIAAYARQARWYPVEERPRKVDVFTDHILRRYAMDDLTYDEVRHDLLHKIG